MLVRERERRDVRQVEKDAAYYAVLIVGLVATVVVTTFVTRLARRALKEATGE